LVKGLHAKLKLLKKQSRAQKILHIGMSFELQTVPGFNHCQLKAGIYCSPNSFLYLQCSSCQYFGQTKLYSNKGENLKR